jgi:hypothetical protein
LVNRSIGNIQSLYDPLFLPSKILVSQQEQYSLMNIGNL